MRRGPTWRQLGVVTACLLTLSIASPALGGPSLRDLVRQEVAKQLSATGGGAQLARKGRRGPRGPAGAQGPAGAASAAGAAGANGTARAYAEVKSHFYVPCTPNNQCTFDHAKGITAVRRVGVGFYCVTAPGISPGAVAAAVTVDYDTTVSPEGNAAAEMADGLGCGNDFGVVTERQTSPGGVLTSGEADDVGFEIVIP